VKSPRGMYDLTGWQRINCYAREVVARRYASLSVASSRTSPGEIVFTEWWWTGDGEEHPVLRDYRDDGPCRHYLATSDDAAASEEDE